MAQYWQEISALTMRWVLRLSREKFSMLFTLVQPMLFWLIFFGNLFQRAADAQVTQAPNYISFLAAGVVVMTVLNNGLAGGVDLLFDKENGFLERLMSTPIHRSSVILSRFIFVMTITSLQVLVILGGRFHGVVGLTEVGRGEGHQVRHGPCRWARKRRAAPNSPSFCVCPTPCNASGK